MIIMLVVDILLYVQVFFQIHIDWLWWIESFIKWHSRSWPFTVRWGIACFESSRFAKASCSVESSAGEWIQKMTSTPGVQIRSNTGVDVTILVRMWIVCFFLFNWRFLKGKVWWHVDFIDLKADSHGMSRVQSVGDVFFFHQAAEALRKSVARGWRRKNCRNVERRIRNVLRPREQKMRPVMTTKSCLVWVVTRKEKVFTKILGKTPTHTTNVNKIVTELLRGEHY